MGEKWRVSNYLTFLFECAPGPGRHPVSVRYSIHWKSLQWFCFLVLFLDM